MLQSYKVIAPFQTITNIPAVATIIQMKRNNIQISASEESINELDMR